MSRAAQQVTQEIIEALQGRIAQWQAEQQKIEILRSRQDRKADRYQILSDLIEAALTEITAASARLPIARVDGDTK